MWQANCRRMHNLADWISGRQNESQLLLKKKKIRTQQRALAVNKSDHHLFNYKQILFVVVYHRAFFLTCEWKIIAAVA